MKILIYQNIDGTISYQSVNPMIKLRMSDDGPLKIGEIEVDDKTAEGFFDNPDAYNVNIEEGTIEKK